MTNTPWMLACPCARSASLRTLHLITARGLRARRGIDDVPSVEVVRALTQPSHESMPSMLDFVRDVFVTGRTGLYRCLTRPVTRHEQPVGYDAVFASPSPSFTRAHAMPGVSTISPEPSVPRSRSVFLHDSYIPPPQGRAKGAPAGNGHKDCILLAT